MRSAPAACIVVDPTEHARLGTMQYRETLPLDDHEVVLTFDDGPLPPYTTRALDILASQCVKATYFLVGRMARAYPDVVRHIYAAGHTIGTHSQNHPLTFHRMPIEQGRAGDRGRHRLGHRRARRSRPRWRRSSAFRACCAPTRSKHYLASRSLMTWSADFPADDWKHIQASEIIRARLTRLEAKGSGVLLLHDIQPATVLALPGLLKELKRARLPHRPCAVPATRRPAEDRDAAVPVVPRGSGGGPRKLARDAPTLTIAMLLAEPALPAPEPESFGIGHPFGPTCASSCRRRIRLAWRAMPSRCRRDRSGRASRKMRPRPITLRTVLPVPSPESFGYGDRFAPAVTPPQTRASLTEPTPPAAATQVAIPAAGMLGAARGKPGGWPVTTGTMPKTGFP